MRSLPLGAGLLVGGLMTTLFGWMIEADLPPGSPDNMLVLGVLEVGLAVGLIAYGLGSRVRR